MRRLFWIGVGVGVTVLVVRHGHRLVERYVPKDAATALSTATKVTRTARGVLDEFSAGLAEREKELRDALLGPDADVAAVKARGRAAWSELRGSRGSDGSGAARGPRGSATRHGVPGSWAGGPLEDPDDDDGYAFF